MEDGFTLPVSYKDSVLELDAKFIRLGFIYQFHINVGGRTLIFERDEERNYRIMDTVMDGKEIDQRLLQAVVDTLISLEGSP